VVEDRATSGIAQRVKQTIDLRVRRGHGGLDSLRVN
jgi:hypothetical protein